MANWFICCMCGMYADDGDYKARVCAVCCGKYGKRRGLKSWR